MSAKQRFKGAALALLWVLTVTLVLVWDQNIVSIVASALGVAATLLVLFSLRWWRAVAALASALFVVNWGLAFVLMGIGDSPLETYGSVIRQAMRSGTLLNGGVVLAYEAALPLLHLITVLVLSIALMRRKPAE